MFHPDHHSFVRSRNESLTSSLSRFFHSTSMYVQHSMLPTFLFLFACLGASVKAIAQHQDDWSIDTSILDSNNDLITSLNPSDTQGSDCTSQLPDDPFTDDVKEMQGGKTTQDARLVRRQRCLPGRSSGSSESTSNGQQPPDTTQPADDDDEKKLCPDRIYPRLVSCGGHATPYWKNPNIFDRFFKKELYVYVAVEQCHAGKAFYYS